MKTVTVEVPEDSLWILGEEPRRMGRNMLIAAVLQWFQEKRLSQGQAAEMLGLKRGEFFDLLYEHHVSPIQMDIADLEKDFGRG
jgi:predicted HTH domain antitoxin